MVEANLARSLINHRIIHHARYVIFQMAEVAVPKKLFAAVLERIGQLAGLGGGVST